MAQARRHSRSSRHVISPLPAPEHELSGHGSAGSSNDDRASFITAHTGTVHGLSPGLRSPNWYASSASGLSSPCSSNASSAFLTPPRSPDQTRQRPWKAPSSSDPALNMLRQPGRRRSTGSDMRHREHHKKSREHQCHAHRKARARKQSQSYRRSSQGWLPVRRSIGDERENDVSVNGTQASNPYDNTSNQLLPEVTLTSLISEPAQPVVSRSWTSVGIGDNAGTEQENTRPTDGPQRGRTYTTSSERVLDFVCSRLSARKVSVAQLETPASITLRRASSTPITNAERRLSVLTNTTSEAITPLNLDEFENHIHESETNYKCPLSAYLITNKDIEQVAEVIQRAFASKGLSSDGEILFSKQPEFQFHSTVEHENNKPSIIENGILPPASGLSMLATTVAAKFNGSQGYTKNQKRSSIVQRVYTTNGTNEIIWEDSSASTMSSRSSSLSSPSHLTRSSTLNTRARSMTFGSRAKKWWHEHPDVLVNRRSLSYANPPGNGLYTTDQLYNEEGDERAKVHFADTFNADIAGLLKRAETRSTSRSSLRRSSRRDRTSVAITNSPGSSIVSRVNSNDFSTVKSEAFMSRSKKKSRSDSSPRSRKVSRSRSVIFTPRTASGTTALTRNASVTDISTRSSRSVSDPVSIDDNLLMEVKAKRLDRLLATSPGLPREGLPDIAETPGQEEASLVSSRRTSTESSDQWKSPGNSGRPSYVLDMGLFSSPSPRSFNQVSRVGSSLGISCRARRRSSMPNSSWLNTNAGIKLKGARFDEQNLQGHEKRKTWKKPRKDSGWPGLVHVEADDSGVRSTDGRTRSLGAFDEYDIEEEWSGASDESSKVV